MAVSLVAARRPTRLFAFAELDGLEPTPHRRSRATFRLESVARDRHIRPAQSHCATAFCLGRSNSTSARRSLPPSLRMRRNSRSRPLCEEPRFPVKSRLNYCPPTPFLRSALSRTVGALVNCYQQPFDITYSDPVVRDAGFLSGRKNLKPWELLS